MVATTYSPVLWADFRGGLRLGRSAVVRSLEASLLRLNKESVQIYQLDNWFPYIGGRKALFQGLARAKDMGLCEGVGVCGMGAEELERAFNELSDLGVPLLSNQVEASLLRRNALQDGTLATCKRLGVKCFARKPLAGGLASGVYTYGNPTGGKFMDIGTNVWTLSSGPGSAKFPVNDLMKAEPLHNALEDMVKTLRNRDDVVVTTTQIALNWVRSKGMVPVVGVNNPEYAAEITAALPWKLRGSDVEVLDSAADGCMRDVKWKRAKL